MIAGCFIIARHKKAFSDRKIFVISFQSITHEAQNALLKLFEEPTNNTHFFLVTATADIMLPTLASRLFIISCDKKLPKNTHLVEQFLTSTKAERLKYLKGIIDSKDKKNAILFLNALEVALYIKKDLAKNSEIVYALKEIAGSRAYLYGRSPSVKMLLEHVALSTPLYKSAKKK